MLNFILLYLNKDLLKQSIKIYDNFSEKKEQLLSDLDLYNKRTAEYTKALQEVYMDKVKDIITEEDFIALSDGLKKDKKFLEASAENIKKQLALSEHKAVPISKDELIEKYTNFDRLDRDIVEILIDHIYVGKRIPKTRNVPIEIHWSF